VLSNRVDAEGVEDGHAESDKTTSDSVHLADENDIGDNCLPAHSRDRHPQPVQLFDPKGIEPEFRKYDAIKT